MRIASTLIACRISYRVLCLSAQMRIASGKIRCRSTHTHALPQRTNADCILCWWYFPRCHYPLPQRTNADCICLWHESRDCLLPLPQRTNADCIHDYFSSCLPSAHFASAHKCGLHPCTRLRSWPLLTLPQRTNADCIMKPVLMAKALNFFASAHKCGLHRQYCTKMRYPFLQIAL